MSNSLIVTCVQTEVILRSFNDLNVSHLSVRAGQTLEERHLSSKTGNYATILLISKRINLKKVFIF